ncbi:MAG: hypothetical protein HQL69_21235, partial [Magnetococcales bacterium]|nr:hypothetical protein [Magnetococcales bacterium]
MGKFVTQINDQVASSQSESSGKIQETMEKFASLASSMDTAGKGTVEAMGEQLNGAISSMEKRQQVMNMQMGKFVNKIKDQVEFSQSESSGKVKETLDAVGEQVVGVVAELSRQAEKSAEDQGNRQEQFQESTEKAVSAISSQMETLLTQSVETNRSLQNTVEKLSQATNKTISDLNNGAETLFVAASDFAKAGQGVSETMQASSEAVSDIKIVAGTLATASSTTREVVADYSRTRDSFATMVSEFKSVAENAKREASVASEFVSRIESATEQLGTAQRQSEDYLEGINEVLVKVHESFSENVERTMRDGNRQFQQELRDAVNMVSAAVKDLGDTLDDIPGQGRR